MKQLLGSLALFVAPLAGAQGILWEQLYDGISLGALAQEIPDAPQIHHV